MNKFEIYAWPAYATRKLNPYNFIIYKNIEEQGYPVYDFHFGNVRGMFKVAFSRTAKIFHIHWPTSNLLAVNKARVAFYRVVMFYVFLKTLKLSGKKVFWTVHNIDEHEERFPFLQHLMNRILYNNVHGFISMNTAGLHLIEARFNGPGKKISIIHHPHYKDYYLNTVSRHEARCKLDIPDDAFVFLFAGQVRKYKNVSSLISAYKQMDIKNTILLIAGKIYKDIDVEELKNQIGERSDIRLINSFIEEEEIQLFMNAADLVVNPYSKIFNSGSAFLNLSFNKPTLAPDMFSIADLKQLLGSRWIKTYQGELSGDILKSAMLETKQETNLENPCKPDIDLFDPKTVALDTIAFYKSFLN